MVNYYNCGPQPTSLERSFLTHFLEMIECTSYLTKTLIFYFENGSIGFVSIHFKRFQMNCWTRPEQEPPCGHRNGKDGSNGTKREIYSSSHFFLKVSLCPLKWNCIDLKGSLKMLKFFIPFFPSISYSFCLNVWILDLVGTIITRSLCNGR